MPDCERSAIDPPEKAKLISVAKAVPDLAVSFRGERVDHAPDEAYLDVLAAVVNIRVTHSATSVEAAKVGDGVPHLREDDNEIVARCILQPARLSEFSPTVRNAV